MSPQLHLVGHDESPREATGSRLLDTPVVYPLLGERVPLAGPVGHDLAGHLAEYGERPSAAGRAGDALLEQIEAAALSGRGGAHFPVARKWKAVLAAGGGGTVVANAAEGEPASAKDAALLQHRPHLVLDGLVAAAESLGAQDAVVWLHHGAHATHRALAKALVERRSMLPHEPTVRIALAPDHYLSGESSAAVRALSGGPALPTFRRTPAATEGVHGRPTLVQNVETLARVGLLARTGAAATRASSLLTLVAGGRRVVVELEAHEHLLDAVNAAVASRAILPPPRPQAVLLGGYGGRWLPWALAENLPVDQQALKAAGASLGAGIVALLPRTACGLAETARLLGYLAASSAKQCGPCLFGLAAVAELAGYLAEGSADASDVTRLRRHAAEITGRGGCHHPDGAIAMLGSALIVFADDVAAHAAGRPCMGIGHSPVLPVGAVPE